MPSPADIPGRGQIQLAPAHTLGPGLQEECAANRACLSLQRRLCRAAEGRLHEAQFGWQQAIGTSLRQLQVPRAQKQPSRGQDRLVGMVGGEDTGESICLSPLTSSSPMATPVSPLYPLHMEPPLETTSGVFEAGLRAIITV